jgi:hypothetical protein
MLHEIKSPTHAINDSHNRQQFQQHHEVISPLTAQFKILTEGRLKQIKSWHWTTEIAGIIYRQFSDQHSI